MSLFKKIRRAFIVSKFSRHDLKIIEAIPTETFGNIVFQFKDKGWELTNARGDFNVSRNTWQGKLRKGTSVLTCNWNNDDEGQIVGLARIVEGLGKDYDLKVKSAPNC